jgi:hypothetical protein
VSNEAEKSFQMYLESVDKVFVHILDHYRSSAFSGGKSFDGPCR